MKQDRKDRVNDLKSLLYNTNNDNIKCKVVSNKYGDDIIQFKDSSDSDKIIYFNLTNIYDLLKRYTGTSDVILMQSEYKDEQEEEKPKCKITTNDGKTIEV